MSVLLKQRQWYNWVIKSLLILPLCYFSLANSTFADGRTSSANFSTTVPQGGTYNDLHIVASTDAKILSSTLTCFRNDSDDPLFTPDHGEKDGPFKVKFDVKNIDPPLVGGDKLVCYITLILKEWNTVEIKEAYYTFDGNRGPDIPVMGFKVDGFQSGGGASLRNDFPIDLFFDDLRYMILEDIDEDILKRWESGEIQGDPVNPSSGIIPSNGEINIGTFHVPVGQFLLLRANTSFAGSDPSVSSSSSTTVSFPEHEAQLVNLKGLNTTNWNNEVYVNWITESETGNSGFRFWRSIERGNNNYQPVPLGKLSSELVNSDFGEDCSTKPKIRGQLEEIDYNDNKLVSTSGDLENGACYSFTDTSNLNDGTYYYLLEDIDDHGNSKFHCDEISTITIGQGPSARLKQAIDYCKEVTGSNN